MWVLVFIAFVDQEEVVASTIGTYETMHECFSNRDMLSETAGKGNGYFYSGSQAICIHRKPTV